MDSRLFGVTIASGNTSTNRPDSSADLGTDFHGIRASRRPSGTPPVIHVGDPRARFIYDSLVLPYERP